MKISEPMLMKRMRNIDKPIPKDYYSFLNDRPLNNPAAILSCYYYLYLDFYFSDILMPYNDLNQNDTSFPAKRLQGFIKSSVKDYDEYISDISLALKLDQGISIRYVPKDEFTLYTNAIRNPELKQYLADRYINKYVLKKGEKAPGFYLQDVQNKSVSLNDFAGNIVYIQFWFTGCKPCIKEIPEENRLVDVFKNEKVKIISICMYSSEESWRQVIEKYGMKSIALFCKGNWDKILKEKYDIASFPQHVLIDKHGKIIANKFNLTSSAEEEIRKWLIQE